jgi:hypothetical protein
LGVADVFARLEGRARVAGQPDFQCFVGEDGIARALGQQRLEIGNHNGVHHRGPGGLELRDVLLKDGIDLLEIIRVGV